MIKTQSNILLISGSGQNTGKTTLVCKLIEHFCSKAIITGIKITHHFYDLTYQMLIIEENNDFKIYEETEKKMPKDSSRMLNAGANKVFYIMAKKEFTGKAMNKLLGILSSDTAIICESGGLSDYFKPGLHLHLTAVDSESVKPARVCDALASFNGYSFNLNIKNIEFKHNSWKLNKSEHDIT